MPSKLLTDPARPLRLASLILLGLAAGCTTTFDNDRVDYKSASSVKATPLDVPPDLTQLSRDTRYQAGSGVVSASNFQTPGAPGAAGAPGAVAPATGGATTSPVAPQAAPAAVVPPALAASAPNGVAPTALAAMRIERDGSSRWLVSPQSPEQLWPQLKTFWEQRGFVLTTNDPAVGVMETDWAENRAKLPQDIVRGTIGKILDPLYSTSERDRFRTRVERGANGGSEIFISHRGVEEVYTNQRDGTTAWQPRAVDPQLEAELLARLMLSLAGPEPLLARPGEAASAPSGAQADAIAQAAMTSPTGPARARVLSGQPGAAMQVDEGFDRAWRRVGLALDRGGFTVEDRDRSRGLYYVRYVDPAEAGKEEPGFFARLLSFGKAKGPAGPVRYRVELKSQAESTTVAVLNEQGSPDASASGQRIVTMLTDALK